MSMNTNTRRGRLGTSSSKIVLLEVTLANNARKVYTPFHNYKLFIYKYSELRKSVKFIAIFSMKLLKTCYILHCTRAYMYINV
jgi:hypothetical protein